jgi:hypothetical protein
MKEHQTYADRLADLFRSMPGQWIDSETLSKVGGRCAWRTRVSNLRYPPYEMQVRNRQRTADTPIGSFKVSEYCYQPDAVPSLEHAEDQPLPWEAA